MQYLCVLHNSRKANGSLLPCLCSEILASASTGKSAYISDFYILFSKAQNVSTQQSGFNLML